MNESRESGWGERIMGVVVLVTFVSVLLSLIFVARPVADGDGASDEASGGDAPAVTPVCDTSIIYRCFDPNVADYRTLIESGVPRDVAVSIIKWRESGKIYSIKEDVALVYNLSDSLYFALEPYIVIGEEFRLKPKVEQPRKDDGDYVERRERHMLSVELEPFMLDTVSSGYLRGLGFSVREAETVLRYRDMIGGYRSFEEFEECYAVDSVMSARLKGYIQFPERDSVVGYGRVRSGELVELNSADSLTLIGVSGIGPKSVVQIMRYRELLGGYYSPMQISELEVVKEDNFIRILPQIWCDTAQIKKININFAAPKALETHPYLTSKMLRKIINKRDLKGGWSTIDEMIEDNIFTEDEAQRIAPYLDFGTLPE